MPFASLGLEPHLLKGVAALGYSDPTPIQSQAIPYVLEGRDVVGIAQTGTGKTAAFVLPVLQRTPTRRGVKTLIVTPTRELALQIAEVVRGASRGTNHRCVTVFGGVGVQPQVDRVRRGADILVACPGRLLDLVNRRVVDLSKVETLVLDEADRMLDMGFWPDVKKIIALVPEKRQNLLFSATMDPRVTDIVESILTDPVRVEVARATTPVERIEQTLYPVSRSQKTDLLVALLGVGDHTRTIVFTRTKHRADRLAKQLHRADIGAAAIHGDRSQNQRQAALEAFKRGKVAVLVATDVVARGIDVDEVSHVVNYDMPNTAEDYVHRIGRTARAGASGDAVSLLDPDEFEVLREIEKVLGMVIPAADVPGFAYDAFRVVPNPEREAVPTRPAHVPGAHKPKTRSGGRRGGKGRAGNRAHTPPQQQSASGKGSQQSGSGAKKSSQAASHQQGQPKPKPKPKPQAQTASAAADGGRRRAPRRRQA